MIIIKGKRTAEYKSTSLVPVRCGHIRHRLEEFRLVWRAGHVAEGDANISDTCRTTHQEHLHHAEGL